MKITINHFSNGLNENLRSDLIDENSLQEMINCYIDQSGSIMADTLPMPWDIFNALNILHPHHFFVWNPLLNLSQNLNDWILLCVSGNHPHFIFQDAEHSLSHVMFDDISLHDPSFTVHKNKLLVADSNLNNLIYFLIDDDHITFHDFLLPSPKHLLSLSYAGIENQYVPDSDPDLGMMIPRGSILQYCYTSVDENGIESNPSPILTDDVLQMIQKGYVWRKTKLSFPPLSYPNKYYKLYRRDNLFSESKAFSSFSFVSKVFNRTFYDIFPSVEFMEPSYNHDFNVKGNLITVSNNRLFLANASRNNMFPYPFDRYIKMEISNNNSVNYINAWYKINLDDYHEIRYVIDNELFSFRFYDTDRITPLKIMRANALLFICIPYLQTGLSHLIFFSYGSNVTILSEFDNFSYGKCITYDGNKLRQLVRNENVMFSWNNRYWSSLSYIMSDSDCKKLPGNDVLFYDLISVSKVGNVYYKYSKKFFDKGALYATDTFFKKALVLFELRNIQNVCEEYYVYPYLTYLPLFNITFKYNNPEQSGNPDVLVLNTRILHSEDPQIFKLLLNVGSTHNETLEFPVTQTGYELSKSILKCAYSYSINLVNVTSANIDVRLLLQFYAGNSNDDFELIEREVILNGIDIPQTIDIGENAPPFIQFVWENLDHIDSEFYIASKCLCSRLYIEKDIYLSDFVHHRDYIENLPSFLDAYPLLIMNDSKPVIDQDKSLLVYSDISAQYFPEENTITLPSPITKIVPDTLYKDNRINSLYLFSAFNIYHYEIMNDANQSFDIITDKSEFYHFHKSGILSVNDQIFFIDQYGIRSVNAPYFSAKLRQSRFKSNLLLSFDPSKNRLAIFDITVQQMIFYDFSMQIFSISDAFSGLIEMHPFNDHLLCVYENGLKLYPSDSKASARIRSKTFVSHSRFRLARFRINGLSALYSSADLTTDQNDRLSLSASNFNKWMSFGPQNACKSFDITIKNFKQIDAVQLEIFERG